MSRFPAKANQAKWCDWCER